MKNIVTISVIVFAVASAANGYTYTYGPGTNFYSKTLWNSESVLVNGGGGNDLNLFDHSSARVENTTRPYSYSEYGIETITVASYSSLLVTGGEIGYIDMGDAGHATLSGGSIAILRGLLIPPIPAVPEDKYIQVICKSWEYNSGTKRLTGVWGDDSAFNIQLVDTSPWPSGFTFDSINFTIVPEPLSLALLGLGGLFVRRYARC